MECQTQCNLVTWIKTPELKASIWNRSRQHVCWHEIFDATDKRRRSPDGQVIYISSDSGASADAHQSADDSRLPAPIDDSQSEDSSYSGSCFLGSPLHHPHSLQEADAAAARSEADYLLQRLSMAQKLAKHEVQQSETSAEDTPCIPTRVSILQGYFIFRVRLGNQQYLRH
jgi:hypothetical protein